MSARIVITTDNGVLDLPKGAEKLFYITRQVYDLNNFETRNADFSKSLELPSTPNNIIALGEVVEGSSAIGRTNNKIACTVVMDSVTIAAFGWLLFNGTTSTRNVKTLNVTIFYGNFSLFNALGNDTLADLNLADMATEWEVIDLLNKSTNTYLDNNIVFPVADWLTRDSFPMKWNTSTGYEMIYANQCGFFLYTRNLLERIFSAAGFTLVIDGSVPQEFNALALACPVTKFIDQGDTLISKTLSSIQSSASQLVIGVTERAVFDNFINNGTSATWDILTNQFTATETLQANTNITGTYTYRRKSGQNDPSRFVLYMNGLEVDAIEFTQNRTNEPFFFSTQISVVVGDTIYMEIEAANNANNAELTLNIGSVFEFIPEGTPVDRLIQPSEYVPKIEQSLFITNILKLYNLVLITDEITKVITLYSFNSILTNPELDLSRQLSGGKETIEVTNSLKSIGRKTLLKWQPDNLHRQDTEARLTFNNDILTPEVTAIDMDFSPCDNSTLLFGAGDVFLKAKIPNCKAQSTRFAEQQTISVQADGNFTISQSIDLSVGSYITTVSLSQIFNSERIIEVFSDTTGKFQDPQNANDTLIPYSYTEMSPENSEPRLAVIHIDSPRPVYRLEQGTSETQLQFPAGAFTASWLNNLRMVDVADNQYKPLFDALQAPQTIKAMFNLSVLQVANFDFLRPVYLSQFNAFYYVNRIEQFKLDSLTRLELIRISKVIH